MSVDVEQEQTVTSAAWRELLCRLRQDSDRIAERLLVRLNELPGYRAVPVEELRPSVLATVRAILDVLRGAPAGPAVGDPDGVVRPAGNGAHGARGGGSHASSSSASHGSASRSHAANGNGNGRSHANGTNGNGSNGNGSNGNSSNGNGSTLTHSNGNGSNGNGQVGTGERWAAFHQLGELRARQGISAGDLVHGWHVACEEVVRRAREVVPGDADGDRLLLHLYGLVLGRLDGGMVASTEGHHSAEVERARREQHARGNLVRAIFSDRLSPAGLHRRAELFRLDRSARYHAVRARPRSGIEAAAVEQYLVGKADPSSPSWPRNGVLALVDDDVCGFVQRLPTEPAPVAVGVSRAVPLHELPAAFRSASRLLEAAEALGRTGLVDLDTLGVEAAVVADDEVGEAMLARYVRPLENLGPAGELILDTVARYLANDGRLDTTARELHVHVNTIRYRLGRFEQVTSHSLRSNQTLVQVWWAMRRRSLAGAALPR